MSPGPCFVNMCDAAAQICMNHTREPAETKHRSCSTACQTGEMWPNDTPRIPYKMNLAHRHAETDRFFRKSDPRPHVSPSERMFRPTPEHQWVELHAETHPT